MGLLTEYVELDELGGGPKRHTIHMRPIAVREAGVLRAMVQDFADGDATWGHVVTRAPLRVRTANDGMRRFLPLPGNDAVYFEMGQPFVQVGGDWTQVSLGTPSRVGKTLTWTRPQTITTVTHGGHFLDLQIELRDGFVPENSRIAFPVGLQGLTRSGLNLLHGGNPVARLRPFAMVDAANPLDTRPISHSFTTRNGQPFLVLTLPSLAGMVRPVIDPTLELQPDATAGLDTRIIASSATVNFGIGTVISAGAGADAADSKGMVQWDVSSIPSGAIVSSALATLYCESEADATDRSVAAHRALTQWYEGDANGGAPSGDGSTWNHRNHNGSVAWAGGAGGAAGSDYATSASDTESITGTGVNFDWTVTADVQAWVDGTANYGLWWIPVTTSTANTVKRFPSSDHATAAQRPKLTVEYTEAVAASTPFYMVRRGVGIPILGVAR